MTKTTQPNAEQIAALKAFADHHGRRWKSILSDVFWYNARLWTGAKGDDQRIGSVLHGIRNQFGPSWLQSFKFPPAADDYGQSSIVVLAGLEPARKRPEGFITGDDTEAHWLDSAAINDKGEADESGWKLTPEETARTSEKEEKSFRERVEIERQRRKTEGQQ